MIRFRSEIIHLVCVYFHFYSLSFYLYFLDSISNTSSKLGIFWACIEIILRIDSFIAFIAIAFIISGKKYDKREGGGEMVKLKRANLLNYFSKVLGLSFGLPVKTIRNFWYKWNSCTVDSFKTFLEIKKFSKKSFNLFIFSDQYMLTIII